MEGASDQRVLENHRVGTDGRSVLDICRALHIVNRRANVMAMRRLRIRLGIVQCLTWCLTVRRTTNDVGAGTRLFKLQ
jgi:hypothetical protein